MLIIRDPGRMPDGLETFKDGRMSLHEMYQRQKAFRRSGWKRDIIYEAIATDHEGADMGVNLPVHAFRTEFRALVEDAIMLIGGIHGEEPAGPNAIALEIAHLETMRKEGIPMVIVPNANPDGYWKDWRMPDSRRNRKKLGASVGSSEHLLPTGKNSIKPRIPEPECNQADVITRTMLEYAERYRPVLVIDLHEDEFRVGIDGPKEDENAYIYSQGDLGADDPVAERIVEILEMEGFELQKEGKTRFGEPIINGIVSSPRDGSIDELLLSRTIIKGGIIHHKHAAKTGVVVETPVAGVPIEKRIRAQRAIIKELPKLWEMALKNF